MNTIAQISPTSPAPSSPIPHSLFEGGIAVAIVLFLLKEGVALGKEFLGLLKKKDADEATLTSTLIDDLRKDRTEQLHQMSQALQQVMLSNRQVAIALQKTSKDIADINLSSQQNARTTTEIFAILRQQERMLISLNEKMERFNGASRNHTSQSQSRSHV